MMSRNMIAHYQQGSSDKVYIASIRHNSDGTYSVVGKYGRRGKTFQKTIKGTVGGINAARTIQVELFNSKLDKGYVDIDTVGYKGPVTRASVSNWLEEEVEKVLDGDGTIGAKPKPVGTAGIGKTVSKPDPDEGVVKCVDNVGIDDRFDEDIEYIFEKHEDDEFIWVYDKFGIRGEYRRNRFEVVDEIVR